MRTVGQISAAGQHVSSGALADGQSHQFQIAGVALYVRISGQAAPPRHGVQSPVRLAIETGGDVEYCRGVIVDASTFQFRFGIVVVVVVAVVVGIVVVVFVNFIIAIRVGMLIICTVIIIIVIAIPWMFGIR